jgi:parallel beta-helix repeat protein
VDDPELGVHKVYLGLVQNTYAIYASENSTSNITMNKISYNDYGVASYFASPTIIYNNISYNEIGVYIFKKGNTGYPYIRNNYNISSMSEYGIILNDTSIDQSFPISYNNINYNPVGIYVVDGGTTIHISNNNVENNQDGIYVFSNPSDDAEVEIKNNNIKYNNFGIDFINSTYTGSEVKDNNFVDNNYSIYLDSSSPKILNNQISNSISFGIYTNGVPSGPTLSETYISGNNISGANISSSYGIYVEDAVISSTVGKLKIVGNNITNNYYAIYGEDSSVQVGDVSSLDNNISNNYIGIYLSHFEFPEYSATKFSNVTNNLFWNNSYMSIRIYILAYQWSSDVSINITNNEIHTPYPKNAIRYGVFMNIAGTHISQQVYPILIKHNNVSVESGSAGTWGQAWGMKVVHSRVHNNNITGVDSRSYGIEAHSTKIIFGNNFTDNERGLYIFTEKAEISYNNFTSNLRGIYTSSSSNNNTIHHNNFYSSTFYHAYDYGANNWWNDSTKGNHWDDYNESSEGCDDIDSNNICDDPNPIYPNTDNTKEPKDNFPLVKPV